MRIFVTILIVAFALINLIHLILSLFFVEPTKNEEVSDTNHSGYENTDSVVKPSDSIVKSSISTVLQTEYGDVNLSFVKGECGGTTEKFETDVKQVFINVEHCFRENNSIALSFTINKYEQNINYSYKGNVFYPANQIGEILKIGDKTEDNGNGLVNTTLTPFYFIINDEPKFFYAPRKNETFISKQIIENGVMSSEYYSVDPLQNGTFEVTIMKQGSEKELSKRVVSLEDLIRGLH